MCGRWDTRALSSMCREVMVRAAVWTAEPLKRGYSLSRDPQLVTARLLCYMWKRALVTSYSVTSGSPLARGVRQWHAAGVHVDPRAEAHLLAGDDLKIARERRLELEALTSAITSNVSDQLQTQIGNPDVGRLPRRLRHDHLPLLVSPPRTR